MLSRRIVHCVGYAALSLFLVGALTGCPLLFGGGNEGTVLITASPDHGRAPLTVRFHGLAFLMAPYEVASWTWDFGDGGTADGRNATHTYVAAGTYTATLTVAAAADKFRGGDTPPPITLTATQKIEAVAAAGPPVANAGPDQTVYLNATTATPPVVLDGSASYDPENDPITYAWTMLSAPAGSAAALSDATTVNPSFIPDRMGDYTFQLIVNDGTFDSAPDTVMITVGNRPPVADAGDDQSLFMAGGTVGPLVTLDGTASSDPDGDTLTYAWTFVTVPAGSTATLANANSATPEFTPDVKGDYVAQLIVNDGLVDSAPDTVTISVGNRPPVANAGEDQSINPIPDQAMPTVTLDGTGSSDPDGDILSFAWAPVTIPGGSSVTLSGATTPFPTFVPDVKGVYVFQLIVNDGTVDSAPDTVQIAVANRPPVANAGPDQSILIPADTASMPVALDGTASYDLDGDTITFAWTFISTPAGSSATLSNAGTATPEFLADVRGDYVAQLIVNDGFVDSAPDTVLITVGNRPPVANAGPDQSVFMSAGTPGVPVALDGTASYDLDGDPITYAWTFISAPAGSSATLSNAGTATPEFLPDVKGNYVAQLIVNDGFVDSAPDTVLITVGNRPPVANAGPDQTVYLTPNDRTPTITLDGTASSDPDGDILNFTWTTVDVPDGSSVALGGSTTPNPTFVPDVKGVYVYQLVVNDGLIDSAPDTVQITVGNRPPVANAGTDQSVFRGALVTLDGSASSDEDGDPITYDWMISTAPVGSLAVLGSTNGVNPTMTPDLPGDYVIQLTVNDGLVDSAPDTVTITVTNRPPVANAGTDQSVFRGDLVTLDGSASSDEDGDPITYDWMISTAPAGSLAMVGPTNEVNPTMTPDLPGEYVIQLTVNDGFVDSAPDFVTITVANRPPVVTGVVMPGGSSTGDFTRDTDSTDLTPILDTLYGLPSWDMSGKAFGWGLRLFQLDPETADTVSDTPITVIIDEGTRLLPFNVTGGAGLAVDPTNGEMWAILEMQRNDDFWLGPYRALARINPRTGVAVPVDDPLNNPVSDWYTGLAFDDASVLYGVTYNEMDQPRKAVDEFHSLYEIDKVDTLETFIFQYPEPADVQWTPGEAIAFNGDDGLMYHVTGEEPEQANNKAGGEGRLFRSLTLDTLTLGSVTLSGDVSWYEPTAMTYAPGTGQFYVACINNWTPQLARMTLSGGTATEELLGPLSDDMSYPITMNGLAFRYDRSFPEPVVLLDASQHSDPEGDALTFAWSFVSVPPGSNVTDDDLSDPDGVTTTFEPDVFGEYVLQVIVNDGYLDSAPSSVTVNYANMEPVADAGADQTTPELEYYTPVQINGGGSYDPDSEDLTFLWTFTAVPTGSTITDTSIVTSSAAPSFFADVASATEPYVLQLTVTDGDGATDVDTVSVTVAPPPDK